MIDFWKAATRRQFNAALDMLANPIDACPDSVWAAEKPRAFWHLAFHTLFFLDLYLSGVDEPEFHPPAGFNLSELGPDGAMPERAYTKEELRAYVTHCRNRLDTVMEEMTEAWATSPCAVSYRNMSNGELLLYNMRHVQHHGAQLNLLLRQAGVPPPDWVSKG